jgi:hypothetical protein
MRRDNEIVTDHILRQVADSGDDLRGAVIRSMDELI